LGVLPDTLRDKDTAFKWKQAPIPFELWRQIVSFFKWTYDTYQCEAQVRLAYNEDLREWRVAVLPQNITPGLFTDEIKVHVDREKALDECGFNKEGFRFVGTVHHHCSASAFQSGTDHADEITQPGYHVTIGKLNGGQCDFHSRASFRGIMYPQVNDRDWLPYRNDEMLDLVSTVDFPEIWKGRLKKKTVVVHNYKKRKGYNKHSYTTGGRYHNYGYQGAWEEDEPGAFYEGFGLGAKPDELPHAIKHMLITPQWLDQRQWFWDFMIATIKCCDTSDMRRCPSILPVAGARWNQQCLQGAAYCKTIVGFRWKSRDCAHKYFFALLESKIIRVNSVGVWSVVKTGEQFDPYAAYAFEVKAPNVAAVLPESKPTIAKANEATAKVLTKKTTELKEALKVVQNELREQDAEKEKEKEKAKEVVAKVKKEIEGKIKKETVTGYEPTVYDMMLTYSDIITEPPKPLTKEMGDHPVFKALSTLLNVPEFGKWMEDCGDFAMEKSTVEEFFEKGDITTKGSKAAGEFANLIVLSLRATMLTRNFMQQKTTELMDTHFAVTPEALDELLEIIALMMPEISTEELQETVEAGLKEVTPIRMWTRAHFKECFFKSMADNS
jgi:hypothetical protein